MIGINNEFYGIKIIAQPANGPVAIKLCRSFAKLLNKKNKEIEMKGTVSNSWLHLCWRLTACVIMTGLLYACGNQENSPSLSNSSSLFKPYLMITTGSMPQAVAIGDVNGDGRNDVVMTTFSFFSPANDYKLIVFTQNSTGALNPPVIYATSGVDGQYPSSVAIGDISNDGKSEVVVGNFGLNIQVFSQDGSGGLFVSATYPTVNSERIKLADLNNDGRLDVVGVGYNTDSVDVFYQKTDGTLNSPTTYAVTHWGVEDLKVGDVNNDGLMDIILTNGRSNPPQVAILTQVLGGSFNAPVYYNFGDVFPGGVAVGDVTGDGKQDVIVTYGGNLGHLGVFAQNSVGALNPATTYSTYDIPESVEIADVNSDVKSDVVVLHGGFDAMGIYLQKTDGTLSTEELYTLPRASHYNPHGLAVGDINGDGLPDVVIASYDNTSGLVVLYHK